jgi:hypothetical protein
MPEANDGISERFCHIALEKPFIEICDKGYLAKVKKILTDYATEIGVAPGEVAFGIIGGPFAAKGNYQYVIGKKKDLNEARFKQVENVVYPRLGGLFVDMEWLDAKEASVC